MIIINFIRGFVMALADSVPGVSGGTIAFIMGFYDDFINSIHTLISKVPLKEKKPAIYFLLKLGLGWIIGLSLSVLILSAIFDSQIYAISSVFAGFIIFSLPLIIIEEKSQLKNRTINIIYTLIGIAIVSLITYFNPVSSSSQTDLASLNFGLTLYLFFVGMIAISAMVLPGISGSTLLLIFGVYAPIILAVKETITLHLQFVPALICFGLGIIVGALSIIKLLKHSLSHFRSQMIYLILGLMLGSLYAIVMGPTTLGKDSMTLHSFKPLYFLLGGFIIFGLDELKKVLAKHQKQ